MIILDTRECKLKDTFEKIGIEFDYKSLDLGDIFLGNEQQEIIIERKTITDFLASLRDTRYRNQKLRLLQWMKDGGNRKVIYLFEEKMGDNKDKTYWGAIVNAIFRDGIGVIQSDGILRTAQIINDIWNKLNSNKFEQLEGGNVNISLEGYAKGDYNSPYNCYLGQLSLIPNISKNIAQKIGEQYSDMRNLLDAIENNLSNGEVKPKKRLEFLSNIMITDSRRLGDKAAEKICLYLLQNNELFKEWQQLRDSTKRKLKNAK